MARTDPAINLRIPAELKTRIEEVARLHGRSTNAEIVWRLELSFRMESHKVQMDELLALAAAKSQLLDEKLADFEKERARMEKLLKKADQWFGEHLDK